MSIRKGTTPIGILKSVSDAKLTNLTVTPTTSQQTFNHTGYDGYDRVVVNAVTSSIDSNIQASNILSGKSILGVAGNVTKLNGTTKTITPTTSNQTVTPPSPYNGFTSVTINAVTSSIDSNIKAENIKKNVSILGVTGTFEGGSGVTIETGTFTPTSNTNSKTISVADNRKVKIIEVYCDPAPILAHPPSVMTCVANLAFISEPFYISDSSNFACYSNLEERIVANGTSITATAYRAASTLCPGIKKTDTTTVSIGTAGSTMYYLAGVEYTYRIYSWD